MKLTDIYYFDVQLNEISPIFAPSKATKGFYLLFITLFETLFYTYYNY